MVFSRFRAALFQIHMWVGLILGIAFALLGLSGSALVYEDELFKLIEPPPAATAAGQPLPLQALIQIARKASDSAGGSVTVFPPQKAGDPALIRVGQLSRMGNMQGMPSSGVEIFVDPVTGAMLGERHHATLPILIFAHNLHGNFLLGRDGRPLVGWAGVGMLLLGLSGLVLWWPKRGQWRYAFIIRRTAKGLRFHREVHAATGIWTFLVFMIVSFSGVAIAFPATLSAIAGSSAAATRGDRGAAPTVAPLHDAARPDADQTVIQARGAFPSLALQSFVLPARRDQAVTATFAKPNGLALIAYLDRGRVIAVRDGMTFQGADLFMATQRPIHEGKLWGPVWRLLVFISGLLPAIFLVTGMVMWAGKYRRRLEMTAPLAAQNGFSK
jgi:uncharacterized iron-regulated membrane protein